MGRIQSSIGLITGVPITDTVEQLMALSARPRDMLSDRTDALQTEQAALTELTAMLVAVRYVTDNLGKSGLYDQREVSSSLPDNLAATMTGTPTKGTYQFTPLQTVQSQQLLSSGFQSDTAALGGGTLSFRFGDHVERAARLELFGGGQGVRRGEIRITDRSGVHAVVDLSTVQTVDDVLEAVNNTAGVNVTAVAHGGGIRLIDATGQDTSNLKVQEVGNGTTAALLGLAGIDVAADVADGADMLQLYDGMSLSVLNDGRGVRISTAVPEIEWTLRDGTSSSDAGFDAIDFSPLLSGTSTVVEDNDLGDILDAINSVAPEKLKAEIGPDGHRLVITDLTAGAGEFTLSSTADVSALADLGLDGVEPVGDTITGNRILGGAKTVLLSSLNGGRGFGQLGAVELNDRSGASDTVDLSSAETLEDIVERINAADVGIVAGVNEARNGIELTDTTGSQAANLIVANADATNTADQLGIAVDADVAYKNSGDMHLQVVAHNTLLDELNGGGGVARGTLTIVDSKGGQGTLNVRDDSIETVGDVIREIDRLGLALYAEINETGDGIRLVDTGGGAGAPTVKEGNTSTAADLHLLGNAEEVDVDGQLRQVIDGSTTYVIELEAAIDESTTLDSFNGGTGVALGTFQITDSDGEIDTLDLTAGDPRTVGDVIEMINQFDVNVEAEINRTNNSIRIKDLAGGEGTLRISEGNSTTASDLHLLHEAKEVSINGESVQVIDGTADGVWSLADLRKKINALGAGVSAMTFVDGSSRPHRLSLTSEQAGKAGQLVIDTSGVDFSMTETVAAQDALLVFGNAASMASKVMVSSNTNVFRDTLAGVKLEIKQATTDPITVTVGSTDVDLVASVETMVTNYNNFRDKLTAATAYNADTDTDSVLTGDATALRLDIDMAGFLSGPMQGAGSIKSLAGVGVSFNADGTLSFDSTKLRSKFAADPDAIEQFFSEKQTGFSDKMTKLIDSLSAVQNSLLTSRLSALDDRIAQNMARIEFFNARLDTERESLYMQFYRMEMAIGKMQSDLSALNALQPIAPIVSVPRAQM